MIISALGVFLLERDFIMQRDLLQGAVVLIEEELRGRY